MKICGTFVEGLYAFRYEGEELNELQRLFRFWLDIQRLEAFFSEHEPDLAYYGIMLEDAVTETIGQARILRKILADDILVLDNIFANLYDRQIREYSLSGKKVKRRWLRLYGLKIDANIYIVTGGGIKLTRLMEDRRHTELELVKMERCRNYLRNNSVFDDGSFSEFMELDI